MADLINAYESKIDAIEIIPSGGGKFEVEVDGKLVYSKMQTGRHAEPGEVVRLVGGAL
jgi:selenoprotein W-related protein